jgi:hypothetical protein
MRRALVLAAAAAAGLSAFRPAAAETSGPPPEILARLENAAGLDGALDRPARLARLCLDARIACGFELRDDVWKRPESKRRVPSATVSQALKGFIGKDYRLAWRDGVLLMTPALAAPAPALDAAIPADSLRAVARKLGAKLTVAGKAPVRADPPDPAASSPADSNGRRALAAWTRPGQPRPNVWLAVYGRDARSGRLYWFWGEGRPR